MPSFELKYIDWKANTVYRFQPEETFKNEENLQKHSAKVSEVVTAVVSNSSKNKVGYWLQPFLTNKIEDLVKMCQKISTRIGEKI